MVEKKCSSLLSTSSARGFLKDFRPPPPGVPDSGPRTRAGRCGTWASPQKGFPLVFSGSQSISTGTRGWVFSTQTGTLPFPDQEVGLFFFRFAVVFLPPGPQGTHRTKPEHSWWGRDRVDLSPPDGGADYLLFWIDCDQVGGRPGEHFRPPCYPQF